MCTYMPGLWTFMCSASEKEIVNLCFQTPILSIPIPSESALLLRVDILQTSLETPLSWWWRWRADILSQMDSCFRGVLPWTRYSASLDPDVVVVNVTQGTYETLCEHSSNSCVTKATLIILTHRGTSDSELLPELQISSGATLCSPLNSPFVSTPHTQTHRV